jgi:hypothetical protein
MSTAGHSFGHSPQTTATDGRTLAIVAVVCSAVGILFPPALLAGLVCGVFALAKGARGLAIVAMVVSILGVALWVLVAAALVLPAIRRAAREANATSVDDDPRFADRGALISNSIGAEVAVAVQKFERQRGTLPKDYDELMRFVDPRVVEDLRDAWNRPFRLTREALRDANGATAKGEVTFVWSAGPDGVWDTPDDFVSGSHPYSIASDYGHPESPSARGGAQGDAGATGGKGNTGD